MKTPIDQRRTSWRGHAVVVVALLLAGGANAKASGSLGRVLEIGTGCGYQAALLQRLARSVISIERLAPLHAKARELLAPLRLAHLRLVLGDGTVGHPPNAPYDSIVAAASGDVLPRAWLDQLAVGGRLVAPLADPRTGRQLLVVVDRTVDGLTQTMHEAVRFVPLKSGTVR